MKKKILIGAITLVLGVGSLAVYADTAKTPNIMPGQGNYNYNYNQEHRETWFKDMFQFRNQRVKEALEKGLITEEEAKTWEEHFEYMDEFHTKNANKGFMPGPGACGGYGMGFGGGRGMGRGMGMMRGRGW